LAIPILSNVSLIIKFIASARKVSEVMFTPGAGSMKVSKGGFSIEEDHFSQVTLLRELIDPFDALGFPVFVKYTTKRFVSIE